MKKEKRGTVLLEFAKWLITNEKRRKFYIMKSDTVFMIRVNKLPKNKK